MPDRRACLFNLKLGDDHAPGGSPYLNHTLHEFGHALGLSHEHQRFDGDPDCGTGGTSDGLMTPYDKEPSSAVDVVANTVSATPDHFSLWRVFAQPKVYLPLVVR